MELNQVITELEKSDNNWTVEQIGECLVITNEDGIKAHLAICGKQITVEALLFSEEYVSDTAALNKFILETHKMIPLTSVGITVVDGQSYYAAFGALSSESKMESIVIEVSMLFTNIAELLDAYSEFLK
ncbi:DUF2170 family protein [Photorhabdus heterorhabditis]|uniref:Cytoplasmic protein n=1 Tax=Photorhabdus heterorhabditis TaxID=880156 RepID=A0A5B0WT83_9GAMM|nr:DUF2170 family protein [Photorhabdus heterorhabditis]KAA1190143.1 DUF2170 family protein [Photorhabdus heterorhabditis]KOY63782.1 cytoplasmic protein [Photorhabdus heterorhabditis]MBS9440704.1 DUF2170 family protein [Photorhabdus heterorhabditis]